MRVTACCSRVRGGYLPFGILRRRLFPLTNPHGIIKCGENVDIASLYKTFT